MTGMKFYPILSAMEKAAQDALRDAAKTTLAEARRRSPTLTGDSDKTGFVRVDDLTVQVGFTSLVSRLQHENLEYQHPGGGEPKFLERAVDQVNVAQRVADVVRRQLGG